jgi:protease I
MSDTTATNKIEGLRVAILATDEVEEAELREPRKALDEAGAKTTLISVKPGKIQAMKHDEKSSKYDVNATFDEVDPKDFDASAWSENKDDLSLLWN